MKISKAWLSVLGKKTGWYLEQIAFGKQATGRWPNEKHPNGLMQKFSKNTKQVVKRYVFKAN